MAKYYFEFMHEGGGTAGLTAAVIEARDVVEACWNFMKECQNSFYGPSPTFRDPDEAYIWIQTQVELKHSTVHGCFRVPEIVSKSCDNGEIWTLYEDSDVRTFFGEPPPIPPAQTEKVTNQRQEQQRRELEQRSHRVQHSSGFGYVVRHSPQIELLRTTKPEEKTEEVVDLTAGDGPQSIAGMQKLIGSQGFQSIPPPAQEKGKPESEEEKPKPTDPKTDSKTYYKRKLGL